MCDVPVYRYSCDRGKAKGSVAGATEVKASMETTFPRSAPNSVGSSKVVSSRA